MKLARLYEKDYHLWAETNAQLLRDERFAELDLAHLVEEVEDMAGNHRRQLSSRLDVLILHLLKWEFQPSLRSRSWSTTIDVQREAIARLLRKNPSLKPLVEEEVADSYPVAVTGASGDTGIPKKLFPKTCPYTKEQILDKRFFPKPNPVR
jgi:hypothetical protein